MAAELRSSGLEGISSVLVVGLGISGRAAAGRLLEEGKGVTLNDISTADPVLRTAAELEQRGAKAALGHHDLSLLEEADLVVVSPGVPSRLDLLGEARNRGIAVWSEVELAWRFARGPVVAVTGTNGKTTTVSMIEWICKSVGRPAVAAGNIGHPFIAAALEAEAGCVLVVEVSSFQLTFIEEFRPAVAVLLNIAEDHFDWHADMEEYVTAKSRMWMNQKESDVVVCNLDDPLCVEAATSAPSRVFYFSRRPDPLAAVCVEEGRMVSRVSLEPGRGAEQREIVRAEALPLPGEHNLENAMAAAAAAVSLGIDPEAAGEALATFGGLPHRLQFVAEVEGIRFYDDSKATNPHASMRAMSVFPGPLVVILGGKNKGLSFDALAEELSERSAAGSLRRVYLVGDAAEEIGGSLAGRLEPQYMRLLPGLEEVFADLPDAARPGDTVLFSPACASFDRYADYRDRGRHFQSMVEDYRERREAGG